MKISKETIVNLTKEVIPTLSIPKCNEYITDLCKGIDFGELELDAKIQLWDWMKILPMPKEPVETWGERVCILINNQRNFADQMLNDAYKNFPLPGYEDFAKTILMNPWIPSYDAKQRWLTEIIQPRLRDDSDPNDWYVDVLNLYMSSSFENMMYARMDVANVQRLVTKILSDRVDEMLFQHPMSSAFPKEVWLKWMNKGTKKELILPALNKLCLKNNSDLFDALIDNTAPEEKLRVLFLINEMGNRVGTENHYLPYIERLIDEKG